jgi:hypothetical protein
MKEKLKFTEQLPDYFISTFSKVVDRSMVNFNCTNEEQEILKKVFWVLWKNKLDKNKINKIFSYNENLWSTWWRHWFDWPSDLNYNDRWSESILYWIMNNNLYSIELNPNRSENQIKWIIAHEVSHLIYWALRILRWKNKSVWEIAEYSNTNISRYKEEFFAFLSWAEEDFNNDINLAKRNLNNHTWKNDWYEKARKKAWEVFWYKMFLKKGLFEKIKKDTKMQKIFKTASESEFEIINNGIICWINLWLYYAESEDEFEKFIEILKLSIKTTSMSNFFNILNGINISFENENEKNEYELFFQKESFKKFKNWIIGLEKLVNS